MREQPREQQEQKQEGKTAKAFASLTNQQREPGLKGEGTMSMQTEDAATGSAARDASVRPILFSGAMVRAILNGSKTQTRRAVKPQPSDETTRFWFVEYSTERSRVGTFAPRSGGIDGSGTDTGPLMRCPFGQPGDRLWVRESLRRFGSIIEYVADGDLHPDAEWVWQRASLPSIHMPRGLSRLTLEITAVRVERVQEISEADAVAEGVAAYAEAYMATGNPLELTPVEQYEYLWNALNEPRGYGWDANPWVWVVEFRAVGAA